MLIQRPNIILVTVDSLRADHLGCYGSSQATSPNLDQFAGESTLFKNAFSNGPNTPHAFPAIMAAKSSLTSNKLGLFDAPVTLPEILRSAGYTTLGFNAANPYVSRFFHYDRGFDEFYDYLDFSVPTDASSENKNGSIISIPELDLNRYLVSEEAIHAKARLEGQLNRDCFTAIRRVKEEPFFLWMHFMDAHFPYLPQVEAQLALGIEPALKEENFKLNTRVRENMTLSPESLVRIVQLYSAAVRQLDFKLGELFQHLRQLDLFDSALIVITADHGEEFLEHGDLQHKSKLFEELIRVPLLMKLPGNQSSSLRSDRVSLMQLAPTILSIVEIESPFEPDSFWRTKALEEKSASPSIWAEASYYHDHATPVDQNLLNIDVLPKIYCSRNDQWKLIVDANKDKGMLFNLIADPGEIKDVYQEHKGKITELEEKLQDRIRCLEMTRLNSRIGDLRKKLSAKSQPDHALRPSF